MVRILHPMTVRELIDNLETIKDKNTEIEFSVEDGNGQRPLWVSSIEDEDTYIDFMLETKD